MMLTVVVLPQPERPNKATTPGVGASNRASSVNPSRRLTALTFSIQRPTNARARRARTSASSSPIRPSANDINASLRACASPSGD